MTFEDKYLSNWETRQKALEKKVYNDVYRLYRNDYYGAINDFVFSNNFNSQNYFTKDKVQDVFVKIYVVIGLGYANWYANNFKKLTKNVDLNQYQQIWRDAFATLATTNPQILRHINLVQGTARKQLIKIFQRRFSDPEFMALGEVEKGRILRSEFRNYSQYQAQRLIRTESTNIANYATMQSASTIFPKEQLSKEWLTARDERVRTFLNGDKADHRQMNNIKVRFNEKFDVPTAKGIDKMDRPADPAGSAANVVNCRCVLLIIPDEDAQAEIEITGIGTGVGSGRYPRGTATTNINLI